MNTRGKLGFHGPTISRQGVTRIKEWTVGLAAVGPIALVSR